VSAPSLSSALSLVEQGLAVFPVSRERTPLIKGWPTKAATTREAVERLWHGFPHAPCVGVACERSDLVVIDRDPRNGGDDTWGRLLLEHGDDWLRSATVATPRGGEHVYLTAQGRRFRSGTHALGPGVDVKAGGGYVVAPESTGEHGAYRWMDGYSITDHTLIPVPEWLAPMLPPAKSQRFHTAKRVDRMRAIGTDASRNISTCISPLSAPLTDGRLRAVDADKQFVRLLADFVGVPDVPVGSAFRCVLHPDEHPSAALFKMDSGHIMYHDFHLQGKPEEWLTFAEILAAQTTGQVRKLNPPEHAAWKIRLLVAVGLIEPAPIALLPLPPDLPASISKVYDGIALLFGCKWLYYSGAPTALAWRFVGGWCGVAQITAQQGIQALVRHGIIEPVGTHKAAYGKSMQVYLPVSP